MHTTPGRTAPQPLRGDGGGGGGGRVGPARPSLSVGEWTESSRDLREGLVVIEHGCAREWHQCVMPTPVLARDRAAPTRVS